MSFAVSHPSFPDVKRSGLDAKQRDAHVAQGWVYDAPATKPTDTPTDTPTDPVEASPITPAKGKAKPDKG